MAEAKPILAITMGDPTGIGPETIVSALNDERVYQVCEPFVVGRPRVMERAVELLKFPMEVRCIERPGEAIGASRKVLCCLPTGCSGWPSGLRLFSSGDRFGAGGGSSGNRDRSAAQGRIA
jgi:4-hydroxy-L-threonine phosphate dehydrogenase PdxA